jgi:hypothetical protein
MKRASPSRDEVVIAVKPALLDQVDVWWQHIVLDL